MLAASLPSMAALRVFEAAARHQSCSAAGDELGLTQSAVSRQLKGLESAVGTQLMRRTARGIELTEAGKRYLLTVADVLRELESAQSGMSGRPGPQRLRIRLPAPVGERWLLPRWDALRRAFPDLPFEFCATPEGEVDGAFDWGGGHWPGGRASYLFGRELALVAAPRWLAQVGTPGTPGDLAHCPWVEHVKAPHHRHAFLQPMGARGGRGGGTMWDDYSLVIEAACRGLGVALVPRELVARELHARELVNPGSWGLTTGEGYHFVAFAGSAPALARRLECWLLAQACA